MVSSTAASLVTGRTKNVGVITPFINRWFFAEVLEGIEGALIQAGYDLTLFRLPAEPEQRSRLFHYFLVRKRVDAIVCVGVALTPSEVELIHTLRRPAVGIGGAIPGITTMSIDDEQATRLATRHLISLGHRRIVHIGGDLGEQMDFQVHARRLTGFRSAMDEAGIEHGDDFRATTFSVPGGYEAALALLADPATRPTAIVAGCDEIAIGAITAARQLGIVVPRELSIVGIDDHPYSGDVRAHHGAAASRRAGRAGRRPGGARDGRERRARSSRRRSTSRSVWRCDRAPPHRPSRSPRCDPRECTPNRDRGR